MPARSVHFITNSFYHIYNRGSEKRSIFQAEKDYIKFLERVKENAQKYTINILCYTLMPNHFHFLLQQSGNASIATFLNTIQLGHAKYFNTKYERVGPLFQGRFKAKPVETDEYLLQLSAYIHRNSIASSFDSGNPRDSRNLQEQLRQYPYSSYRTYLGYEKNSFIKSDIILNYFSKSNPKNSYRSFVENFVPDYEALSPLLAGYD